MFSTPEPKACATCCKKMRPVRSRPDQRYPGMDVVIFACDCGQDDERLIARREWPGAWQQI
jgi:hypothetical protein